MKGACASTRVTQPNPRTVSTHSLRVIQRIESVLSEVLLPVVELVLVALLLEDLAELRRPAEEHGDLALLLLVDRFEDLVPVGSAGVGASLEAGDEVSLRLDKNKAQDK